MEELLPFDFAYRLVVPFMYVLHIHFIIDANVKGESGTDCIGSTENVNKRKLKCGMRLCLYYIGY